MDILQVGALRDNGATRMVRRGGYTLVELLVSVFVIAILASLLLPAIQSAREGARRASCINNLKQIGIGVQAYATHNGCFPPSMLFSDLPNARPGELMVGNCFGPLSRILPDLELTSAFNSINFDLLPDLGTGLTANHTVMLGGYNLFTCPSDGPPPVQGYGRANYRFSIGSGTMMSVKKLALPGLMAGYTGAFPPGSALAFSDFADGLSMTVGVSERLQGDWTQPAFKRGGDYHYSDGGYVSVGADGAISLCNIINASPSPPQESRGGESWFLSGLHFTNYNHCASPNSYGNDCSFVNPSASIHGRRMVDGVLSASSFHPGGVMALTMGGDVRFVRNSVSLPLWRALSTRSSGEIADLD